MNIPNIKDLVTGSKKVVFIRYQAGELWYRCEDGFEFPVPIFDTGNAAFLPEDKAILFMRWIRKYIELLKEGEAEIAAAYAAARAFVNSEG